MKRSPFEFERVPSTTSSTTAGTRSSRIGEVACMRRRRAFALMTVDIEEDTEGSRGV
jgi:hypothetical protein